MQSNLNELQLAFAYGHMLDVIGSDTVVDPSELSFLRGTFPDELLRTCGFLDPEGRFTQRFVQAREEAGRSLPSRLTQGQKLALVELLVGAAASDGVLAAEEADALHAAARSLGLGDEAWQSHFDQLVASGRVRRDETGID
ncbi:MAG: TerB family tellurite resistance protein [Myxococcales bacterium]|nr:TerB family tellurite resistance protein [Myxococcales bacterium]